MSSDDFSIDLEIIEDLEGKPSDKGGDSQKHGGSARATSADDFFVDVIAEEEARTLKDLPPKEQDQAQQTVSEGRDLVSRSQVVKSAQAKGDDQGASEGALRTVHAKDLSLGGDEPSHTVRKKGRIGDKLIEMGLISEDQLNIALQEKKTSKKMLGEILVELGFLSEDVLSSFLAEDLGVAVFDPRNTIVDGEALGLIDKETATKHSILPISVSEGEILVAMADPYYVLAMDALKRFIPKGLAIKPTVSSVTSPRIYKFKIDSSNVVMPCATFCSITSLI
jgi:hypothetical protein